MRKIKRKAGIVVPTLHTDTGEPLPIHTADLATISIAWAHTNTWSVSIRYKEQELARRDNWIRKQLTSGRVMQAGHTVGASRRTATKEPAFVSISSLPAATFLLPIGFLYLRYPRADGDPYVDRSSNLGDGIALADPKEYSYGRNWLKMQ